MAERRPAVYTVQMTRETGERYREKQRERALKVRAALERIRRERGADGT